MKCPECGKEMEDIDGAWKCFGCWYVDYDTPTPKIERKLYVLTPRGYKEISELGECDKAS